MADTPPAYPSIVLHWLEKSRAQRILWLLEELRVPYTVKTYKRDPKTTLAPRRLQKVHPLGKSPVLTIGDRVLAESGFITEYLCAHFAHPESTLVPPQWKPGCEGQVDGETEAWFRYRYYLHYCEGSLMTLLQMSFIPWSIKRAPTPFFLRPITSRIASKLSSFIGPSTTAHLSFLESQLASAPDGGPYLCGPHLTGADILISFPLLVAQTQLDGAGTSLITKDRYPRLYKYAALLRESEGCKRAIAKIVEVDGSYDGSFF
ncbi:Glutathione S-transferase [Mycena kentingensis (nom. inval.)]|nr:Glutathione S-transferase [Mycena kentingensis (nom. inval.)]